MASTLSMMALLSSLVSATLKGDTDTVFDVPYGTSMRSVQSYSDLYQMFRVVNGPCTFAIAGVRIRNGIRPSKPGRFVFCCDPTVLSTLRICPLCVRPITPHPGRPTLARLSLRQEVVRLRLHTHHFLRTRTHACARACMTHTRPPASSPPAPVHESGAPGLKSWCLRSRRPGGGSCGATWAPTLGARSTSVPRALRPQAVGPPLRRRSPTWCRHRSSPPCAP